MPRKKQLPTADQTVAIDAEKIEQDAAAIDKNAKRLVAIDEQYGDGMPYDYIGTTNQARFYLQQSSDAMLAAGRCLVLLKEHEPHGQFEFALMKLGLEPRVARKLMQAAVKFSNRPLTADLGKTKMFELMALDDDSLDALEDGGSIAGLTLDDIDRMSTSEVRLSLRKEREAKRQSEETTERLFLEKDKKINELDAALHRKATPDETTDALSEALERATTAHVAHLLGLEVVIGDVLDYDDAPQHLRNAIAHSLSRIQTALDDLRAKYAVEDITHDPDDDRWIDEARNLGDER